MLDEYFSFDIAPYAHAESFESGDILMEEYGRPDKLLFLHRGRAKVTLTHENGRLSLVNFLDAPCFIGEMELLDQSRISKGVFAVSHCECTAIDTRRCRERLLSDALFLRKLCLLLSEKTLANTLNYTRNQSFPLDVRLARFILLTQSNGIYREKHTEVAEYLGVTYRHLLYVLADFTANGVLVKTKSGYRIAKPEMLQRIARQF